jgi:hypothetical protein
LEFGILAVESTWDVTVCNLAQFYRRFGEMYCLRFQGRRLSHASKQ